MSMADREEQHLLQETGAPKRPVEPGEALTDWNAEKEASTSKVPIVKKARESPHRKVSGTKDQGTLKRLQERTPYLADLDPLQHGNNSF